LERFPSGKFATNALVLSCGLMAFNILRLCGQNALQQERELPSTARRRRRTEVRRRRLRSVMQDLFYMASRLTKHAHRFGLSLWENNPWREIWGRVYHLFLQPRYIS
jgi:hypothetical protein